MKIFMPTRCHLPRIRTHKIFPVENVCFIVHTDEDRGTILRNFGENCQVLVSNVPEHLGVGRLCWMREWLFHEHVNIGEWSLLIDDNIERVIRVNDEFYNERRIRFDEYFYSSNEWREIYGHECSAAEILALAEELIQKCEEQGTIYGGISAESNYFYRASHWRKYGYVKGKFCVYKNDGSTWRPFESCMFEDFVKTFDVVARYGSVVVNNFAHAVNPLWEAGGIGSYEERTPYLIENVEWLVQHYPGLARQHETIPTHVQFAVNSDKKVLQWRKEHGYV